VHDCIIQSYNVCLCSFTTKRFLLGPLRNSIVSDSSELNRSLTNSGGTEISELSSTLMFKSLKEEIIYIDYIILFAT